MSTPVKKTPDSKSTGSKSTGSKSAGSKGAGSKSKKKSKANVDLKSTSNGDSAERTEVDPTAVDDVDARDADVDTVELDVDDIDVPAVDDLAVKNEGVELVLPPPPSAEDATNSTRRPPPNHLPAERPQTDTQPTGRHETKTQRTEMLRTKLLDRNLRTVLPNPFSKRIGGVAPFVTPNQRLSRRTRLREMSQRGFVPLSPGKQKLRHRILPRSVIGIATMLMCVGIGAAFSGAAFYAYYDDRLAENERTVARFVQGFDAQFTDAAGALDDLRVDAIEEIRTELGPLEDQVTDAEGVIALPKDIGPSVWMLETRDEDGQIANGAAFAIVGHKGGTALVTSYSLTVASTTAPSPGIDIVKGNQRIPAQLWAWDEERDLALVVVEEVIPPLQMAGENAQIAAVGGRVFAMSGVGGQGATASPGVLLDHSLSGLQHTVPVGTLFAGGPLVDGDGKVVGVAVANYRPYGLDPGAVAQAPDVRSICAVVLACSEIREEVVVEVANDETEAPERGEEPVREVEEIEEEEVGSEDEEVERGGATTIDPNEVVEDEEGDAQSDGDSQSNE